MHSSNDINEILTDRAGDILYAALEIESAEARKAFLDRACEGDARLRSMLDQLLASWPAAGRLFQEGGVGRLPMQELSKAFEETSDLTGPIDARASKDEFPGQSIGAYKILEKIGEGGCGAVYLAEQEQPVRRLVALKIIKLGMDTKSVIARFEAERQALALMDHPNIARVLDAGATETGRPFFVMEHVPGVKITEYCDRQKLDPPQRLKLFIKVCNAIQHAHQKGVVHRDIKPSNVLVSTIDAEAVPKVIDFGIAKAIEGRLADAAMFTPYEQFIGTPAYMSPEQATVSGQDVDTRSDIYSLGVLLYELLTGRTPFETEELLKLGMDSLRRTLAEREPQRPSVMLTALRGSELAQLALLRHAEPLKLIHTLRGDLDWIVIRCLEKDRTRRYETANGLAMDVQRFLDNEPVMARPPSRIYRLKKLMRRNLVMFLAGAMVAGALIVGLGIATWFWHQEREARRQLASLLMEARDGERIATAAFLISQNKIPEADDLVRQVSVIKPSLEAESVLRMLGGLARVKWAMGGGGPVQLVAGGRLEG